MDVRCFESISSHPKFLKGSEYLHEYGFLYFVIVKGFGSALKRMDFLDRADVWICASLSGSVFYKNSILRKKFLFFLGSVF